MLILMAADARGRAYCKTRNFVAALLRFGLLNYFGPLSLGRFLLAELNNTLKIA